MQQTYSQRKKNKYIYIYIYLTSSYSKTRQANEHTYLQQTYSQPIYIYNIENIIKPNTNENLCNPNYNILVYIVVD